MARARASTSARAAVGVACCRDDCTATVGRNGIGCHEHFVALVPGFLARSFHAPHDTFTAAWLARNVRSFIRQEGVVA